MYLASRQLADIEAHIRQAFSWTGVAVFFLAIAIVKVLHELGHAYQAIGRGLRVPVMGVAFFAFLPLLYTDVTDAWRLRRRSDRVMVDLGGVLVELTVAVYATLTWCFLPDGPGRTVAFAVATSSWVLSLLVNLNPLMRFDGYYLLSDSLGIQNLHRRATAMGKWAMRRWLFGLDDPAPENFDRRIRRFLIGFAYSVWIYRLFLFIAISLLVYSLFFKLAGVALLVVSVSAFIVKPVLAEVLFWISVRKRILKSPRGWVTFSIFAVLLALLFWPISTRVYVPAVLAEARQQAIFPPQAGLLEAVFVSEGDRVAQGDPLFQFADPELPERIRQSETRIAMHKARLLSAAGDATERAEGTVVARMLDEENQNLAALIGQKADLVVTAAIDGEVRELSTELDVGTWYARTAVLGRIVQDGALSVRGFINETDLERLDPSREAEFVADELSVPTMPLERIEVSDFAIDWLSEGYLSRPNGGTIAVTENDAGGSVVAGVWYPVSGVPVGNTGSGGLTDDRVLRGTIIMHSKPQAYAVRIGNRVAKVLVRELEF
jgi:putative peptide zinc metalloprotease protein